MFTHLLCLDYSGEELSDSSRDSENEKQKMDANSTDNPLIVTLNDEQKESQRVNVLHMYGFKSHYLQN